MKTICMTAPTSSRLQVFLDWLHLLCLRHRLPRLVLRPVLRQALRRHLRLVLGSYYLIATRELLIRGLYNLQAVCLLFALEHCQKICMTARFQLLSIQVKAQAQEILGFQQKSCAQHQACKR
jgi:hypothetical protein